MKKLLVLLVATFSMSMVAQEKLTEGVITTKMTMSSDNEQMKASFEMMGDMNITTYFKDKKSRAEMDNPMTGETITIVDAEDKMILTMMNNPMMGKIYTLTEMKDTADVPDMKAEKIDETKTINGYECQKYNVTMKQDGVDLNMEVYTTDQIEATSQQTAEIGLDMDGFPLLMVMNITQQGMQMNMTYEVTDIKKESVSDDKFDMTPLEGYKKMDGM